jgi:hypothetical protein
MKYMKGKRPLLTREGYLGMGLAAIQAGVVVVVCCGEGSLLFCGQGRFRGERSDLSWWEKPIVMG